MMRAVKPPVFQIFGPLTLGTTAKRPVLIVAALLIASFVVGVDTRVFTVGLPDLRGAYALGFDEASWLSTIANAPQILIASAVAWLATVFGIRRVMIPSCLIYALISLCIPLVHESQTLFALHALRALLLGVFIPATIMVIFRNLEPRYWLIGIAIYALRIPLSQNLGFALVGIYGDYLGWQWLYWQDVLLAPLIALLLVFGAPREAVNVDLLKEADWGGMLLLGTAMTMLYIGIDQGNRLDWFKSGIVTPLVIGGAVLTLAFFINESLVRRPWAHVSVILSRNIGLGFAALLAFAFSSAASSIFVPAYLQSVVGLRPISISELYLTAAVLPSFAFVAIATIMLYRFDVRLSIIIGLSMLAVGSLIGMRMTSVWAPASFFWVVLLHTGGQSFAFFATVVYTLGNSDPKRATAASAYVQVIRIFSTEMAGSLLNTFVRVREQYHSNVLGGPISSSLPAFRTALEKLEHVFGTLPQAVATIAAQVKTQAFVLAYADAFVISFWIALAGIACVAFMGALPFGPLHPEFRRRQAPARLDAPAMPKN